jgi:spore coat polysaccharide biosynthesis protein SpsF
MKVSAFIQARMGSTRLPGKILLGMEGGTVLWHIIQRVRACKFIDDIIIVSPDTPDNRILEKHAKEYAVKIFFGDEENVLDRFVRAAEQDITDIIVRITADMPFFDIDAVDKMIKLLLAENLDFVFSPNGPRGAGPEVIKADILKKINQQTLSKSAREHVTLFIRRNLYSVKWREYHWGKKIDADNTRLTLDTEEDAIFIRLIYKKLYKHNNTISLKEVLTFLKKNPHYKKINDSIKQKYPNE